ncbi:MAG TPA: hypothetical protein PLU22_28030, partial [Polyangiaceae bacterium]|nr:hypothetical protein [Polyangiaceae bacterium]
MARGWSGAFLGVLALSVVACTSTTAVQPEPDGGSESGAGGDSAGGGGEGAAGGDEGVAGESGAAAGATVTLCDAYCGRVQVACAGDTAVYTGEATCLGVCGALPPGAPGDEIGNSVECRLRQAEHAIDTAEPAIHCPGAGPGGDGTCGQNCESYCVLLQRLCPARFDAAYDGLAACATACTEIPDASGFTTAISQGDSLQCRLWHVSAAAV